MTPMQVTCRNCATAFVANEPAAVRCPRCGYAEPRTTSPLAATSTDRSAFSAPVSQPVPGTVAPMPQPTAPMIPYGAPAPMATQPQAPAYYAQAPAYYPHAPQPYGAPPPYAAPQPIVVIQNQVNAPMPYGVSPYAMMPYVRRKDPGVAALISFFLPGGGQLYNGQVGKGVAFLLVSIVNFVLMFVGIGFLTGIATWIWSMVDAHQTAEKINRGLLVP
jgi:TM2 domain-containing membrane protein YozV